MHSTECHSHSFSEHNYTILTCFLSATQLMYNRNISTLLAGRQEGHPACKKLGIATLLVMIQLELCMTCSSGCHQHLYHHSSNKNPERRHSGTS